MSAAQRGDANDMLTRLADTLHAESVSQREMTPEWLAEYHRLIEEEWNKSTPEGQQMWLEELERLKPLLAQIEAQRAKEWRLYRGRT